jgi:hypothetical protein
MQAGAARGGLAGVRDTTGVAVTAASCTAGSGGALSQPGKTFAANPNEMANEKKRWRMPSEPPAAL